MKQVVIADTSGLFSLASETDRNYSVAVREGERLFTTEGTIIVPSDVFTETMNILGKKSGHPFALKTADILLHEPAFLLVEAENHIREEALAKLATQNNDVSFTDCVVMVWADHFKTKHIFGFDEVFTRNGYTALQGK
jgi:predicted nucleic acid-binding protein